MYDPNAYHYKLVFPIKPPGVYTGNWTDEDWTKYVRSFRPADYMGEETDKEAWAAYCQAKQLEKIRKDWPNFDVTPMDDGRFHFERKAGV